MTQRYMTTASGRKVFVPHPLPGQITIEDIATHLGRVRRFVGASPRYFSVAQHSVIVGYLAIAVDRLQGGSESPGLLMRHALLHDAAEYLTNDVPSPIKALIGTEFRTLTQGIDRAIAHEFDLHTVRPASVYLADKIALELDSEILMAECGGVDLLQYVPHAAKSAHSQLKGTKSAWYEMAVETTVEQMDEVRATKQFMSEWNMALQYLV